MGDQTGEKDIESQVLEAIKEVLSFKDPKTVKASILLTRIRTILGLKDLAAVLSLHVELKNLARHSIPCDCKDMFSRMRPCLGCSLEMARKALTKAGRS